MNKVLLAAAFVLVAAAVPSYAQQATTKDQLMGSWKVLSLKATTGDKVSYPLGEQVAGYVTITPNAVLAIVRRRDAKSTSGIGADRC
jgi:hypothetical protein